MADPWWDLLFFVSGSAAGLPSSSISEKWSEVAQLCMILFDPMDCSLPGSSIHGIFQARVLEWVAISFSRGSSQARDWTQVSHIEGRRFTLWPTRKAPGEALTTMSHSYIFLKHQPLTFQQTCDKFSALLPATSSWEITSKERAPISFTWFSLIGPRKRTWASGCFCRYSLLVCRALVM